MLNQKRNAHLTYKHLTTLSLVLLYFLVFAGQVFCQALQAGTPGTAPRSYSFGEVILKSAIGESETPFAPLSFWNFVQGWLEPWIPPPNGELHLQRGGWVNTASGFFSREIDPTFSFFAGTSGTRDEYVGSASLFVPFNRRFQLGLFVPFIDSLQSTGTLPSETSFGDIVVTTQVMLEETETLSVSALLAIRTPTGDTTTHNDKTMLTPSLAVWQDLPAGWQWRGGVGMDFATHRGEVLTKYSI